MPPQSQYHQEYYKKNRSKILEKSKIYRSTEQHKETITKYNTTQKRKNSNRDASLKKRYGISLEDYNTLLIKQDKQCAICKVDEEAYLKKKKRNFDVDHCHKTGKVRGLLCYRCNVVLGFIEESSELLNKLDNYILLHNE